MEDTCICIPTLNEEEGIGQVISDFQEEGFENILVIDGHSTDNTREIAKSKTATVIKQNYNGNKGAAMREAIDLIDEDIIIFVDGDNTYEPSHAKLLRNEIKNGHEQVIACRFGKVEDGAMSRMHMFGNFCINAFFTIMFLKNFKDILTGYRAIYRPAYENLKLNSDGFCIETELMAKAVKNKHNVKVINSNYYKRTGDSELQSFRDGSKIIKRIFYERLKKE